MLVATQVAKRKLAQAHLWLIFKAVSAYHRQKQVCTDDLVQAGLCGLDTALDKFDPDRGNRLSTVAYMWIKEAVGRAYIELTGTIKISERTRINVGCACSDPVHPSSICAPYKDMRTRQVYAHFSQQRDPNG